MILILNVILLLKGKKEENNRKKNCLKIRKN